MDVQTTRAKNPLSLALVIMMLVGIVFATAPAAEAQSTCFGHVVTVNIGAGQSPTNGNDVIMGTNGADVINAKSGDDIICGLRGNDTINGQGGNDTIYGENGNDKIFGGSSGDDIIRGGNGADIIWGRNGDDVIYGEGGADKIYGEDGNDKIYGGNGTDTLWGGNGTDVLNGDGSHDTLYGEAGNDTLNGGYGTDTANGGTGTDNCTAEAESNCETIQIPTWVDGTNATLSLDHMSEWDFTISWGAVSASSYLVISVIDSDGVVDSSGTGFGSSGSYTVNRFEGYALDPNEVYRVEVTPVNSAGSGAKLGLYPISPVRWDVSTVDQPQPQSFGHYSSQPGIVSWAGYGMANCSKIVSTAFPETNVDWGFDLDITFEAWTSFCRDGDTITRNIVHKDCNDDSDYTSVAHASESNPASQAPNSNRIFNTVECSVSGDGTYTGSITAKLNATFQETGASLEATRKVTQATFLDANITITHEVVGLPTGYCWVATHTDARSDGNPDIPPQCSNVIS